MKIEDFVNRGRKAQECIDAIVVRDPQTPAEWQDAVNAAEAALLLDSARQYGLVRGGPTVHVERCDQILAAGRARRVNPIREGVDAHIAAFVAGKP